MINNINVDRESEIYMNNKYELYLSFDRISNIEAEKVIENYMHSFGYIQFAVDSTTLVIKEKQGVIIMSIQI